MVTLMSLKKAEIAGGVDSLLEKLHGLLSGNDVMHIWDILSDVKEYSGKGGKRIAKRMKDLDDFYNDPEVSVYDTSDKPIIDSFGRDIESYKIPVSQSKGGYHDEADK